MAVIDREQAIRDEVLARAGYDYDLVEKFIADARVFLKIADGQPVYLYQVLDYLIEHDIDLRVAA